MHSIILVLCLLFAIQANCVDPSPDFNLTDFAGEWNINGIFSKQNNGIAFYSCGHVAVTVQNLIQVTFYSSYIDTRKNSFVQDTKSFVHNALNKGVLISTTNPNKENNYVVTYYNVSAAEAILINQAATFGYVLSKKSQNPLANHLKERAENLFTSLNMTLNNATFIFNKNCETNQLNPIPNFDLKNLKGKFYGNAIYTSSDVLQNASCFTISAAPSNQIISLKANITYQNRKIVYTEATYLSPMNYPAIYINNQIRNVPPFVLIFYHPSSSTFVIANGDRTNAFIFSTQTSLPDNVLSQAKDALIENRMIPRGDNFYVLQTTCLLSGEQHHQGRVDNIFA